MVAVVWLGYDDNSPTGLTGSSGALKVWSQLFKQLQIREWPDAPPPDVRFVNVNYLSGLPTEADCEFAISVPFVSGAEPEGFQSCHQLTKLELPDFKDTIEIQDKVEGVVDEVKDWFESLFGGSSKRTENGKDESDLR